MNLRDLARSVASQPAPPRDPFGIPAGENSPALLACQFEDLLDAVWRAEREWALDDRIELGWRLQQHPSGSRTARS